MSAMANTPLDRTAGMSGLVQVEALRNAHVRSAASRYAAMHVIAMNIGEEGCRDDCAR
jgi:hypothetical protein